MVMFTVVHTTNGGGGKCGSPERKTVSITRNLNTASILVQLF